jgi:hypothetical protein
MSKISEYKSKHRKVESMRIEPADNGGFVTHTHHDMQDNIGKGASIHDTQPETCVHNSCAHLIKHIKAKFAGGENAK